MGRWHQTEWAAFRAGMAVMLVPVAALFWWYCTRVCQ